MFKSKFLPSITLVSICIVVALLLAVVNMFTAPIIEQANADKANAALTEVFPNGKNFKKLDISGKKLPSAISEAYSEGSGGYVFKMTVVGYKPELVIMCGVSSEGKILGYKVITSNETPDKLSPVLEKLGTAYNGKTVDSIEPEIVGGSTMTSKGLHEALKAALQGYTILGGGEVDLRTPEEIRNDACNEALGTSKLTFSEWFAYEETGAEKIYLPENETVSSGIVVMTNGKYIGVSSLGEALGGTEEEKRTAELAFTVYASATLTQVELPAGASDTVKEIYRSGSGNYVFLLHAKGYGLSGGPYSSGLPIVFKLAVSSDGRIISTLTLSQKESPNVGDICAKPEYYEQYNGKTENDFNTVENVASATVSTSGYKNAVSDAFAAFEFLKGENA